MDDQEAAIMINDCEKREERLSEWERDFIDSISRQIVDGSGLSKRQAETLESIWDKATKRG